MEKAEIVQRRVLRRLLRANHTVANEILLFDLGILSIKGEMDKRLLDFRYKMQNFTNTFIKSIFSINRKCKLGWEQRCQESMAFYNMEPNLDIAKDTRYRLKKIKDTECMHRLRRLDMEVTKITVLYWKITKTIDQPMFTRLNTRRMHAIWAGS